jgi:hypothetical protein
MSSIIKQSDFIGKYAISTPPSHVVLVQQVIDDVEVQWMNNLLGLVDSLAFRTECAGNNGVPTSAQYLTIFNALQLSNWCDSWEQYSSGVKDMLLNAVVVEWYTKSVQFQGTTLGTKQIDSSNSKVVSGTTFKHKNQYNLALTNYRVIQRYIYQNSSDFPDFKGINKNYSSPF